VAVSPGGQRNTAPAWKKLTIIVVAVGTVWAVGALLEGMGFWLRALVSVAAAVAVVWVVARLIGIRLGLSSWD
jgi:hypothetical protein